MTMTLCTISFMKIPWFAKVGVEEFKWTRRSPNLNPTEHLHDVLEHQLHPRAPCLTPVSDLTNTHG